MAHGILAAAAAALVLTSCSERARELGGAIEDEARERVRQRVTRARDELAAGAALSADLTEAQQLEHKLAFVHDCLASTVEPIRDGHGHYRRFIADDGAARRKGRAGIVAISERRIADCTDAAGVLPRTEPSLPALEQAFTRYVAAVTEYAELAAELSTYYGSSAHEADGWKTSKALAPRIAAAYEGWSQAHGELSHELDTRTDEVERALLTDHERTAGRDLEHTSRTCVLEARALVRCIEHRADDRSACAAEHEAFERSAQQLAAQRKANAGVFWIDTFAASVDGFRAEAGQAVAALRDGKLRDRNRTRLAAAADTLARDLQSVRFGT